MKPFLLFLVFAALFVACDSIQTPGSKVTSVPIEIMETLYKDTVPNFVAYKYTTTSEVEYYFHPDTKQLMFRTDVQEAYMHGGLVFFILVLLGIVIIALIIFRTN